MSKNRATYLSKTATVFVLLLWIMGARAEGSVIKEDVKPLSAILKSLNEDYQ